MTMDNDEIAKHERNGMLRALEIVKRFESIAEQEEHLGAEKSAELIRDAVAASATEPTYGDLVQALAQVKRLILNGDAKSAVGTVDAILRKLIYGA